MKDIKKDSKDFFDMLVNLSKNNQLVKALVIVKNNEDGWRIDKVEDEFTYSIIGNICGHEDMISESLKEHEYDFELKDGCYNVICHTKYDDGQKCPHTGRWECAPYYEIIHIEFEFHCEISEWEIDSEFDKSIEEETDNLPW